MSRDEWYIRAGNDSTPTGEEGKTFFYAAHRFRGEQASRFCEYACTEALILRITRLIDLVGWHEGYGERGDLNV